MLKIDKHFEQRMFLNWVEKIMCQLVRVTSMHPFDMGIVNILKLLLSTFIRKAFNNERNAEMKKTQNSLCIESEISLTFKDVPTSISVLELLGSNNMKVLTIVPIKSFAFPIDDSQYYLQICSVLYSSKS